MRNLLSANFVRLWKSRFFWVIGIAVAVGGVFVYGLTVVLVSVGLFFFRRKDLK